MKRNQILIIMTILVFVSSCTLFNTPPEENTPGELSDFRAKYLTSFDILNGTFSQSGRALMPFNLPVVDESQARATVPVGLDGGIASIELPGSGLTSAGALDSDYPEAGQRTSWTIENMGSNLYRIKVLTAFPAYDPREKQEEWYYIEDQSPGFPGTPDFKWTNDDPVVKYKDSTITRGAEGARYRELNLLTFRDGSTQNETIVDVRFKPDGFSAFDVTGSLDYPDAFLPKTDGIAEYSSVVVYSREYNDYPAYSFWSGKQVEAIVGARFYTEYLHFIGSETSPSHLIGTTLTFEKTVTSFESNSGSFMDPNSSLFLPYIAENPEQAFLSLTVLRQETTYKIASYDVDTKKYTLDYDLSTRDTRAQSRVVNIPLQQDSYITLINNETTTISSALDSFWIPQENDAYYISPVDAPLVNTKKSNIAVSTSDSNPVMIITDDPIGALGTFYVAVTEGAAPTTIGIVDAADRIPGDLTGETDILEFTGAQGSLIMDPDDLANPYTYTLTPSGTVQAWVLIDKQTRDGGIVHAGIRQDFKDEIISLQFIGNNNTPAFAVVAQGPRYDYDLVQSSEKLQKSNNNRDNWYHLVATWNRVANNLSIYVNGVLRGTSTFSNIKATSTFAVASPVVVGSQFYDATNVLSGYYGTEGKINGVLIDDRAWSASEIKTFYDNNKNKTANWK